MERDLQHIYGIFLWNATSRACDMVVSLFFFDNANDASSLFAMRNTCEWPNYSLVSKKILYQRLQMTKVNFEKL